MKKSKMFSLIAGLSALTMLAACTSSTVEPVVEDLAYLTVEINPGLGVMVDEDNQVAFAHALNADGEMVMLQLQLEGKSLEEAIEEIVDETVALEFIPEETTEVDVEIDVESNLDALKAQIMTQTQTHLNAAFEGNMLQVQTQTRTYTQLELDEATAKDTTPLKLRLVKQAMIGNDDLLEEEALELDEKALLNMVKNGATNMKKIAASLGAEFLEARKAIQDEYKDDIIALKEAIATAEANSEDTTDLEDQLATLREEMVTALQALVSDYRQQTTQARETWQIEANNRKGGSASSSSTSQPHVSTSAA